MPQNVDHGMPMTCQVPSLAKCRHWHVKCRHGIATTCKPRKMSNMACQLNAKPRKMSTLACQMSDHGIANDMQASQK
ncbi:hypothetical protein DVH24_031518 [Malus domestica]|uniref:Uncharacterized protein n=1 Tax=Malus domestica TaxID=3750 RepID=A0A498KS19_MALDO|nr:hypothetical protein DVH24_031518 [Malus domestica]